MAKKTGWRLINIVSKKTVFAFTLAEVLITLGIIGIVAALTMPALIANYKVHVIASKLNKFYSVVNNAYIRAKQDNGDISSWNLVAHTESTELEKDILYYILPYMNVIKNCGRNESGCAPKNTYYGSIGSTGFGAYIDGNPYYAKTILSDGEMISSLTYGNSCSNSGDPCAQLRIDVNGAAKPNRLGVDLFSFFVYKDRIIPGGSPDGLNSDYYINRGDLCTAYVMYEKKMDYIKAGKCDIYNK